MPIGMNGNVFEGVAVLSQPNSYKATVTPENMQRGMTAVVKGKIVEGTGKCFEFAIYGQRKLQKLTDKDGNTRYGISLLTEKKINVVFVIPSTMGDILLQDTHIIDTEQEETEIGVNYTSKGKVYAFQEEGRFRIFLTDTINKETKIKYFIGKDTTI